MAKFRKKPVVIEAFRLNERGLVAEDWFWDAVTRNDIITHCFGKHEHDPAWCEIKTLEGTMIANAGDYIIQGVHGEIYPCKSDIFQKTYTEDKPKTNADCIRAMSDEELAEFIYSMVDGSNNHNVACYGCINYGTHHSDPANKGTYFYECDGCENEGIGLDVLMWLQQPAEGE